MQSRTAVTLVMRDGEELAGVIEWYDRDCIKLNRENAPNLMVYKDCIKYVYKSEQSADDEEDLDERED
jgi:sRNA-binding regulator protein Hfq